MYYNSYEVRMQFSIFLMLQCYVWNVSYSTEMEWAGLEFDRVGWGGMVWNAIVCNVLQCNSMQCYAMLCNDMLCNAMLCDGMKRYAMQWNVT